MRDQKAKKSGNLLNLLVTNFSPQGKKKSEGRARPFQVRMGTRQMQAVDLGK
jgi:hypothetical protein